MAKRKGINWNEQPLGVVNDGVLARRLGVSVPTVRQARARRGIGARKREYVQGVSASILELISDGECWRVSEIARALDRVDTWVRYKLNQMMTDGQVIRHQVGSKRQYVYSLPGVKYKRRAAFIGTAKATLTATERERTAQYYVEGEDLLEPGTVSFIDYDTEDRSDAFYCSRKRKTVTLAHCVELFGEIHAYQRKDEKCYGCSVGAMHRLQHCYELDACEEYINDVLRVAVDNNTAAEARLCRAMERKQ